MREPQGRAEALEKNLSHIEFQLRRDVAVARFLSSATSNAGVTIENHLEL